MGEALAARSWHEAVTLAEASIRRAAALGASEELAGLHDARARGLDAGGHRTDAVAAWRASVTATLLDDVARRADRLRRLAELEWTEGLFAAAGGSIEEAAALLGARVDHNRAPGGATLEGSGSSQLLCLLSRHES